MIINRIALTVLAGIFLTSTASPLKEPCGIGIGGPLKKGKGTGDRNLKSNHGRRAVERKLRKGCEDRDSITIDLPDGTTKTFSKK